MNDMKNNPKLYKGFIKNVLQKMNIQVDDNEVL